MINECINQCIHKGLWIQEVAVIGGGDGEEGMYMRLLGPLVIFEDGLQIR